jgi:hypothetical protein
VNGWDGMMRIGLQVGGEEEPVGRDPLWPDMSFKLLGRECRKERENKTEKTTIEMSNLVFF